MMLVISRCDKNLNSIAETLLALRQMLELETDSKEYMAAVNSLMIDFIL